MSKFNKTIFLKYLDKLIIKDNLMEENNISMINNSLENILSNRRFKSMINTAKNNWLELPVEEVMTNILKYLSSLELVDINS